MFSHAIYHAPSPGLFRLIAARDFADQSQQLYVYDQNIVEKVGRAFRYVVGSLLDVTFQNIRNPLVLVSLTGAAMFAITVAFYHVAAHKMLITLLPVAAKVEAWMLKGALYGLLQTTVAGISLRAIGRLSNPQLIDVYTQGQLKPVYVGLIQSDR